jgi:hypothetical protein
VRRRSSQWQRCHHFSLLVPVATGGAGLSALALAAVAGAGLAVELLGGAAGRAALVVQLSEFLQLGFAAGAA